MNTVNVVVGVVGMLNIRGFIVSRTTFSKRIKISTVYLGIVLGVGWLELLFCGKYFLLIKAIKLPALLCLYMLVMFGGKRV